MMTKEQALDALVEKEVAKWGESEREPSRRAHKGRTLGDLLNALVYFDPENPDMKYEADAKAALTPEDLKDLREAAQ